MNYGIDLKDPSRTHSIVTVHNSELTWIHDPGTGGDFSLMQVDPLSGMWVVRSRFSPGTIVQSHLHSGYVTAVTLAGQWRYPEMDGWCESGDYLVELAGTVHSLQVTGTGPADIVFAILGTIVYFGEDGSVDRIEDWRSVLDFYRRECALLGLEPRVIGAEASLLPR